MESFFVAINAVIPFFCYLALGYTTRMRKIVTEEFMQKLNQMTFKVFYPFMTFYNIYKADANALPKPILLIFTGASILIIEGILILVIPKIVKENPKRGVVIQAIFRSNVVLFGLPLTLSVFGDSASSVAAMVITVAVTIYNITSVMILEMFRGEGKTSLKKTMKAVLANPLLQGAIVGLIFFFLGIRLPSCLVTPISAFANLTSPLAIFILGSTLQFRAIGKNLKYIVPTLACKLIVLPAIILVIACAMGFRGLELFLLVSVYATPVAAASYPMAQNMGGDGELAGQLVVISTAVSMFTLFFWIFFMKSAGLF